MDGLEDGIESVIVLNRNASNSNDNGEEDNQKANYIVEAAKKKEAVMKNMRKKKVQKNKVVNKKVLKKDALKVKVIMKKSKKTNVPKKDVALKKDAAPKKDSLISVPDNISDLSFDDVEIDLSNEDDEPN